MTRFELSGQFLHEIVIDADIRENRIEIKFSLDRGCYATSVLREIATLIQ